jgi:hypothetical protein
MVLVTNTLFGGKSRGNISLFILLGQDYPNLAKSEKALQENYRSMSLMNIERKILSNILANPTIHIKNYTSQSNQVDVIQLCKVVLTLKIN